MMDTLLPGTTLIAGTGGQHIDHDSNENQNKVLAMSRAPDTPILRIQKNRNKEIQNKERESSKIIA